MGPGRRVVRLVEAGAGQRAVVLEGGLNGAAESWQRYAAAGRAGARARL